MKSLKTFKAFNIAVEEMTQHLHADKGFVEDSFSTALTNIARELFQLKKELDEEIKPSIPVPLEEKIKVVQERLEKDFGDQPAGVPVPLCEPGLDIVLAGAYIRHKQKKNKPQRQKELDQIEKQEAEDSQKWETMGKEAKHSAIRSFARYFSWKYRERWVYKNKWWSNRLKANVNIFQNTVTGKVRFEIEEVDKVEFKETMYANTYNAAKAWKIEDEMRALELLKENVSAEQYNRWLLTGMLVEKSRRSGIDYIFRRLRPTLAFRDTSGAKSFLAALCHHPVGYYQISWAGALVPTDDLLSHLLMMRADEHRLWKVSTQHTVDSLQGDF